tara:strand:+ start:2061 stop:2546 length:486 start_codon:yes stop_codon:yes gene_type:complete
MKEKSKMIGKQLLEIIRFILFIPAGFLAGTIVKIPFLLLARIKESILNLDIKSFGTDLWQALISMRIFGETQIWQTLIFYIVCFYTSIYVKPKFLRSKYFILAWSILLGLNAIICISDITNPDYSTRIKIIIDSFAPIGVLIYLIKDEKNDFLKLSKRNKL